MNTRSERVAAHLRCLPKLRFRTWYSIARRLRKSDSLNWISWIARMRFDCPRTLRAVIYAMNNRYTPDRMFFDGWTPEQRLEAMKELAK